ncbi:MAG TPA: hypothetical protein VMY35_15915 [Phycisphaerae bacterium]|nr:hypothetical protein [Phycisphaerae bacterium]
MRSWVKPFGLVLVAAILMGVSFVAGAVLQPTSILKTWICMTERNAARKQIRLGQMLRQGMSPEEVKAILGNPSRAEDVGSESRREGVRWHYSWGGCAGSGLIIEFRHLGPPGFNLSSRLCYAHIESGALHFFPDTDPKYFTIGRPLASR